MQDNQGNEQRVPIFSPPGWLNNDACPYWDRRKRACNAVKDGLFMPIDQHVATYCTSDRHPSCHHYQVHAEEGQGGRPSAPLPVNRRRSLRLPSRQLFRYSEITANNETIGFQESQAWTVNLSNDGLQVSTRYLLSPGSLLRFEMEHGETGTGIEGTGRVIWSLPLANTPYCLAGLAFTERRAPSLPPRHI